MDNALACHSGGQGLIPPLVKSEEAVQKQNVFSAQVAGIKMQPDMVSTLSNVSK